MKMAGLTLSKAQVNHGMALRPEILFPLFSDLTTLDGIGPKLGQLLIKAGINHPKDLLFHLPNAVIDRRPRATLQGMPTPGIATVEIEIGMHHPSPRKGRPYRIFAHDAACEFQLVFFNAAKDWLATTYPSGQRRVVSGRVEMYDGMIQMTHPDYALAPNEVDQIPPFEPQYQLTAGVTGRVMRRAVDGSVARAPKLDEWIDPSLLAQKAWPDWETAVAAAHEPKSTYDASPSHPARERLAYDEFLSHQATLALAREHARKKPGQETVGDARLRKLVLDSLPFTPTGAQTRAVAEIATDLGKPERMNRLLQGDVGSGKTLVALLAALIAVEAGGQAVIMAPTEVLARQHLLGLEPLLEGTGVDIDILTGRTKSGARADTLGRIENGDTGIVVGTHALFQSDVTFKDLRLAIVDEQHRFGVHQRMALGQKGDAVDVLVMTATPIPRSLELSQYGDMALSVLDEKPPGRKPIDTVLVPAERRDDVVERMKSALADGKQAYWVCPLVSESETIEATAAEARFKDLRAKLGEDVVGLVHGQLPPAEKDEAMRRFTSGETRLLVATTIIEVGVDVPNASIMVIEGAQSFGLAQLHQLRGRVGRGSDASSCLLLYDAPLTNTATARLKIMRETNDGFRIAEEDLAIRGAGDLLGAAQSGLPRFKIADPETQTALMETAQKDARTLITKDPKLTTPRGKALRVLLHLMEREKSFTMLSVG